MTPVLLREHKQSFGPYLRTHRKANGLTLRDASTRLGITFAKLQKMETGGRFRIDSTALFDAIAAAYARPLDEVLAAAGVVAPPPRPTVPDHERVWAFTRTAGWTRSSTFLVEPSGPPEDPLEHPITTMGYGERPCMRFGSEDGVNFSVHTGGLGRNCLRYTYLVWLNIGSFGFPVAVPSEPDLLLLMAKLKPLADPYYTGLVPATGGWVCDGKRVAAFALTAEGRTVAMVANGPEGGEDALTPGLGRLVG
jgi:transcriptional regulator with XRE-family HTH domain